MNYKAITDHVTIKINSIPNDISDDFSVTIENDNNPMKIIAVRPSDVNHYSTFTVEYVAKDQFTLDSLKVTCKYPIKVYCEEFILGECIVPDNYNKAFEEEKRLWKICIYSQISHNIYFSGTRELTESEAVEWYKKYNTLDLIKDGLHYKKDGEWVTYEITK